MKLSVKPKEIITNTDKDSVTNSIYKSLKSMTLNEIRDNISRRLGDNAPENSTCFHIVNKKICHKLINYFNKYNMDYNIHCFHEDLYAFMYNIPEIDFIKIISSL